MKEEKIVPPVAETPKKEEETSLPKTEISPNKDEKIIKISFRSQGGFDVNEFAREHFNGGGHRNAAGGKSELSMEETIAKFEKIVNNLKL